MKINIEVVKVAQVVESWRAVPNNRYTNALADDGDRVRVGVAMIQSLIDVALHAPQITNEMLTNIKKKWKSVSENFKMVREFMANLQSNRPRKSLKRTPTDG